MRNVRNDAHFSYREYFGGAIFREPRKGLSPGAARVMIPLGMFVGIGWVLLGIFLNMSGFYVGLGVVFVISYSAELLPKRSTRLAGILRLSGFGILFISFIASLVNLWRF